MRKGNAVMLAVLSYAAPLVSTLLLIVTDFASPSWRIALATVLIMLGGLVSFLVTRGTAGR